MAVNNLNPAAVPPTAAEIATAVAAPSAATIAAAVAAPSSATIATAVAAAVPTISAINTSVANNAPSPNAWVFLGSASLSNVSIATVSFSSYRTIRVVWKIMSSGGNALGLRLNGDSGSQYNWGLVLTNLTGNGANATGASQARITNAIGTNTTTIGYLDITNAHLTNWKGITAQANFFDNFQGNVQQSEMVGNYMGTSAITSVSLLDTGGGNWANNSVNNPAFQVFGMN